MKEKLDQLEMCSNKLIKKDNDHLFYTENVKNKYSSDYLNEVDEELPNTNNYNQSKSTSPIPPVTMESRKCSLIIYYYIL